MRNLRQRIEKLEAAVPRDVGLFLRDGTRFHYPGGAYKFWEEGLDDMLNRRSTPLVESGSPNSQCGGMWPPLATGAGRRSYVLRLSRRHEIEQS